MQSRRTGAFRPSSGLVDDLSPRCLRAPAHARTGPSAGYPSTIRAIDTQARARPIACRWPTTATHGIPGERAGWYGRGRQRPSIEVFPG